MTEQDDLSTEQLFAIEAMKLQIANANAEQLRELLVQVYRLSLRKDTIFKRLLGNIYG